MRELPRRHRALALMRQKPEFHFGCVIKAFEHVKRQVDAPLKNDRHWEENVS